MQPGENEQQVPFSMQWVAKIALSVAAIAAAALLLAIFLATDDSGSDYAHVILTHSLTRQSLGPAILVFGLLMVVVAAIATWLIALYGSFRIAGPLFRFSHNLQSIIDNAFAVPMAIRQTDMLQGEWKQFDASQARLRDHYGSLRQALDQCRQALQAGGKPDEALLRQALARLQEVERRVQL
jgi:low affinity Fe/Cu permease